MRSITALVIAATACVSTRAVAGESSLSRAHALVIGTNYDKASPHRLEWAESDALGFAETLRAVGWSKRRVHVAQRPTRAEVLEQLDAFVAELKPADTLVFYFSGHAFQRKDGSVCLALADADFDEGADVASRGLSVDVLSERLGATKAGTILVVLDACRNAATEPVSSEALVAGWAGLAQRIGKEPINAADDVRSVEVWYACEIGQRSSAHEDLEGSVFTHFLREGLDGKASQTGERDREKAGSAVESHALFKYAQDATAKWVDEHGLPPQRPVRDTTSEQGIVLAGVPKPDRAQKTPFWAAAERFAAYGGDGFNAIRGTAYRSDAWFASEDFPDALDTLLLKFRGVTRCVAIIELTGSESDAIAAVERFAARLKDDAEWSATKSLGQHVFRRNDGKATFVLGYEQGKMRWFGDWAYPRGVKRPKDTWFVRIEFPGSSVR